MSKRFTDTEIWTRDWYVSLSSAEKMAFGYIKDNSDIVGVWTPNTVVAGLLLREEIDWDSLPGKCNGNIEVLPNGKWWLVDFCRFQYGTLNPECRPHRAYIKKLREHGLLERVSVADGRASEDYPKGTDRVSEGYPRGTDTPKDKDKDTDKELDQDKDPEETPAHILFALDWYRRYNVVTASTVRPSGKDNTAALELFARIDARASPLDDVLEFYFQPSLAYWWAVDKKTKARSYNFRGFCENWTTILGDMTAFAKPAKRRRLCPHCNAEVPGTMQFCAACGEEFDEPKWEEAS